MPSMDRRKVWVIANVAGKQTTLQGDTWQALIGLIVDFVKKNQELEISWSDLYWQ